jgi:hypothetical protein
MRLRTFTGAVALTVGALIGLPTAAHAAAADATPPKVVLKPHAHYALGSRLDTAYEADSTGSYLADWYVSYALSWKASDASGICSQTLTYSNYDTLGGDDDPVLGQSLTIDLPVSARSYTFRVNSFDWYRVPDRFVVRATDCAGNTRTSGVADTGFGLTQDDDPGVTYTGTWATSRFTGFSGGTTHQTSTRGSAVTFAVGGGPVALVMEKAANRGSADVYVDGVRKATVNTNAATTAPRQVVWQATLAPGSHQVRVVCKATAGHPRIDVDALLTS